MTKDDKKWGNIRMKIRSKCWDLIPIKELFFGEKNGKKWGIQE